MDEPDTQGTGAPADAKPHFRTYASDVAALTGSHTPLPKELQNTPAPDKPTPIQMPAKAAAPATPAPVTPPAPPTPPPPAPTPQEPYAPPPAEIIPKAPNTDESREAVLARLRAKAAVRTDPAAPPPAPVIPKAPSTDEAREAVLARLRGTNAPAASGAPIAPAPATPAPAPAPVPRPTMPPPGIPPVSKTPAAAPSAIHTYKSDFSDKAKETGASRISILAAEQNAKGAAAPVSGLKPKKKSVSLLVAGAALLILAGGASIYFAIAFVTGHPPVVVAPAVPSLIFADDRVELKGTAGELRSGLANLSERSLPDGGVAVAYVTYSTTTEKGKTITLPAAGGALISAMGLPAPEILLRNIDPASTVGAVHAGAETRPFFIFRVASFERTFAGMLNWEATMDADLGLFYPPYPELQPEVQSFGTTTASSTDTNVAAMPFSSFSLAFTDDVVDNHDVRVLRDSAGRSVLLYGYRDKQTLIIARDEAAFSELLKRLASTRAQ